MGEKKKWGEHELQGACEAIAVQNMEWKAIEKLLFYINIKEDLKRMALNEIKFEHEQIERMCKDGILSNKEKLDAIEGIVRKEPKGQPMRIDQMCKKHKVVCMDANLDGTCPYNVCRIFRGKE